MISLLLLGLVIGGNVYEYKTRQPRVAETKVEQPTTKPVVKTKKVVVVAKKATSKKQLTISEEQALKWIIAHEGGSTSVNKSSLACGIAQSLPCSKVLRYAGVDMSKYNLNTYSGVKAAISTVPVEVQRAWMLKYIHSRYWTCVKAQQFWLRNGWY